MLDVKDTDQCRNCGDEFGNHDYVPDSIDKYKCPHPHQDSGYGRHKGGDPNKFFPDYECCTPEEIQAWKDACTRWDSGDCSEDPRRPYGIGVYVIHYDQFFEPREHDDDLIPDEIEDFEFDADLDDE